MYLLRNKNKHISVLWITNKFGNFTKDKVYVATAKGRHIDKEKLYTDFRILDKDGDEYILRSKEEGKFYIVL